MDQRLSQLVEDLTTSGEAQLDPEKIKALKKICKHSDEHINHIYHLLMAQLNQEHAEIRLSAFQIVDELFIRSHLFRTLIISNFQEFLELTVETNYHQPLPPPTEVAQKLKKAAIRSVQEWHEKYGNAYKKLSLGYHFLKQNKKVDFQDIRARTLAERKRDEEKQKRLDSIYKDKAEKALREMEDRSQEIKAVLTEMENCFQLLVPDVSGFTVNDTADWEREDVDKTRSCSSVDDDEQPCCSKDVSSSCLVPKLGSRGSDVERLKNEGVGDNSPSELTAVGVMGDDDRATFLRNHGLGSYKYTLSFEVPLELKLSKDEDNSAIINNVTDGFKLITNNFLPSVQSWIQLFTKAGISDDRLRRAIDLKNKLETVLEKTKEMNIDFKEKKRKLIRSTDDEDDDDDEDFVEVPEKEGYEPHIPDHLRQEYGLEPAGPTKPSAVETAKKVSVGMTPPQLRRNEEDLDPTSAAATWKIIRDKLPKFPTRNDRWIQDCMVKSWQFSRDDEPATSVEPNGKCDEEKAKAPFVPFGMDLYYWGKEQPTSGKILKFSSQHSFWTPNEVEEEVENKEVAEMLQSRYITFAGKFEPVKHKCRAPMPNGGLCERQDRLKCPFHGKIIPRDESGIPVNQEDRDREAKEEFEKKEKQPEWQDPEFMREVEAATGVNLGSLRYSRKRKGGKKKEKKKKYPNLTDLKQQANTSRSRLGKKVFNKAAVKRVVKAMNRADQKKHEKFANQFNYALH